MLDVVRKDFILSTNPNCRKGGLLALAATAIALGQVVLDLREMLWLPLSLITCYNVRHGHLL